jgi:phosphatidate cytidylyltransferase
MLGFREWLNLTQPAWHKMVEYVGFTVLAMIALAAGFAFYKMAVIILILGAALAAGMMFLTLEKASTQSPLAVCLGVVYLGLPLLLMVWLRADVLLSLQAPSWAPIALLFAIVWSFDSAAYFSGRAFGGPKLAPTISPNKTWSGTIGGVIAAIMITLFLGMLWHVQPLWVFGLVALIVAVFAQAGDLYESALKRRVGIKDSGQLIPGHGGILDRIDGLLVATPVYAALVGLLAY